MSAEMPGAASGGMRGVPAERGAMRNKALIALFLMSVIGGLLTEWKLSRQEAERGRRFRAVVASDLIEQALGDLSPFDPHVVISDDSVDFQFLLHDRYIVRLSYPIEAGDDAGRRIEDGILADLGIRELERVRLRPEIRLRHNRVEQAAVLNWDAARTTIDGAIREDLPPVPYAQTWWLQHEVNWAQIRDHYSDE